MTAKEMFEALGYEYKQNNVNQICVCNIDNDEWLWFYLDKKTFEYNEEISMELLKVINKQVEELGWLNENEDL